MKENMGKKYPKTNQLKEHHIVHILENKRPISRINMSGRRMKVSKCPSDVLTMTNRAIVSPADFDPKVILNGIFTTVQLNEVIVYRVQMNANPLLRNGPGTTGLPTKDETPKT